MSKNVFANGNEISAKKDGNKSICAMPDVCLSPPSPPAGPVPIPYPNTAKASDTSQGSKSVKIGGAEVGLKNSSCYKKSMGDEAATKSLGMGVVTHNIQGKMKFAAWSFDVKIEGKNVTRHMDLTTHNHMNTNNSGSMTCSQAKAKAEKEGDLTCEELDMANQDARDNEIEEGQMGNPITVTTAVRTDSNGNTKFMRAVSGNKDQKVKSNHRDDYQDPIEDGKVACSETENYNKRRKHDSEPKLIQPEFNGGGTMKMKIFHQSRNTKGKLVNDCMPCGSCKKVICIAQACGLNIILCNEKNEEVKAEDLCEDGKPKGDKVERKPNWADSTYKGKLGEARTSFWKSKGL